MKKILVIGEYKEDYPRNKVLLESLGDIFDLEQINITEELRRYSFFSKKIKEKSRDKDFILVMQPVHKFAFRLLFFKLFSKKILIVDAFTSIYDSFIHDRKLAKRFSLKALYYYLLDWLSCFSADYLIFDTYAHRNYFSKKFFIVSKKKKIVLPVTVDLNYYDNIKFERDYTIFPKDKFNLFFYGYYIPLQGVEYIVKAAEILKNEEDINFVLVGSGQTRKGIDDLHKKLKLNNITFIDRVPFDDLIKYIKMSDACLGIFGKTEKAKRVIPNKLLDYMACRKIVITGKNNEEERYFKDKEDLFYVNMADEKGLAEKIKYIYENREDFFEVSASAREKVVKYFSKESLVEKIKKEFN